MAKNHDTFPTPQGEHRQADFDLAAYKAEGHVNSALLDELPPLLIAEMAKWCGEEWCPTLVAFLKSAANEYPQQIWPGQNMRWSTGTTDPDVRAGQLSRCVSYAERDGRLSDVYGMAREMRQNYGVWRNIRWSDGKDNPGQGPSRIFRSLMPKAEAEAAYNYSVDRALTALYDNLVLFMQADCGAVGKKIVRYRQLAEQSIKRAATIIEGMSGLEQGTLLTEIDVDDWIARMVNEPPRKIAARGL